jgi:hypothetical protein
MIRVDQVVVFFRDDRGRHLQDRRRLAREPLVAQSLKRLRGWVLTPLGRQRLNFDSVYPEVVRNLNLDLDQIGWVLIPVNVNKKLQRGERERAGRVDHVAPPRVPPPGREQATATTERI